MPDGKLSPPLEAPGAEGTLHPSGVSQQRSSLRFLVPLMIALAATSAVVWSTRPKPVVVEAEPSPPPKSAAEIKKQIEIVSKNKDIPPGQKGMILGLLKNNLAQAKAREAGAGELQAP